MRYESFFANPHSASNNSAQLCIVRSNAFIAHRLIPSHIMHKYGLYNKWGAYLSVQMYYFTQKVDKGKSYITES